MEIDETMDFGYIETTYKIKREILPGEESDSDESIELVIYETNHHSNSVDDKDDVGLDHQCDLEENKLLAWSIKTENKIEQQQNGDDNYYFKTEDDEKVKTCEGIEAFERSELNVSNHITATIESSESFEIKTESDIVKEEIEFNIITDNNIDLEIFIKTENDEDIEGNEGTEVCERKENCLSNNITNINDLGESGYGEIKTEPIIDNNQLELTVKTENVKEQEIIIKTEDSEELADHIKTEDVNGDSKLEHYKQTRHLRVVLSKLALFPCMFCENVYTKDDELHNHVSNEHKSNFTTKITFVNKVNDKIIKCNGECDNGNILQNDQMVCIPFTNNKYEEKSQELENCINKKKTFFKCPYCPYSDTSKKNLCINHIFKHHKDKDKRPYSCQECGFKFRTRGTLTKHVKMVHDGDKLYACSACPKRYGKRSNLNRHLSSAHEIHDYYSCLYCCENFSDHKSLIVHESNAHNMITFKPKTRKKVKQTVPIKCFHCSICKRNFKEKAYLDFHMLCVHQKSELCHCYYCFRCFSSKKSLQTHISMVHLLDKPFQCYHCGFKFNRKNDLEKHIIAVHLREKSFKCSQCKARFSRKAYVKTHIRVVHDKIKPHSCDFCQRSFTQKCRLKVHIMTIHNKVKPFTCYYCQHNFASKQVLSRHIFKKHLFL